MDIVWIALGAALWMATWGLARLCARLQPPPGGRP